MKIQVELDEAVLKTLVVGYLKEKLGEIHFTEEDVKIQTKSKQNHRSEWESAAFRAVLNKP